MGYFEEVSLGQELWIQASSRRRIKSIVVQQKCTLHKSVDIANSKGIIWRENISMHIYAYGIESTTI